jgi:hypothetical protein
MAYKFNPLTGKLDYYESGTSGGGLTDAPSDGSKYARQDAGWVAVLDGVEGPQGPQGIQGETGLQGIQGETGPAGADGGIIGNVDGGGASTVYGGTSAIDGGLSNSF